MEHVYAAHTQGWWILNIAITLIGGFFLGHGLARIVEKQLLIRQHRKAH